ncbi:hypothetical protein PVT67_16555 [Gallaecimonas kandeliae]|uniref:hypothetical protein n=1 Tax=Gallaecimonas kandeliae TaxID=3029055 RepID=UPI0026479FB2|nr:hypothetical protein [Gallaecimonas kandeliae]WKE65254.1 hypothetical protein PVT67_16555 [Gallaecimonas kandeliae]
MDVLYFLFIFFILYFLYFIFFIFYEYKVFMKKYVDPRGVPSTVVESVIENSKASPGKYDGTFIHAGGNIKAIVNHKGKVVSVVPSSGKGG